MVSLVENSATAGSSGVQAEGLSACPNRPSLAGIVLAFVDESMMLRILRLWRIGTSDMNSTPPATTASHWPAAIRPIPEEKKVWHNEDELQLMTFLLYEWSKYKSYIKVTIFPLNKENKYNWVYSIAMVKTKFKLKKTKKYLLVLSTAPFILIQSLIKKIWKSCKNGWNWTIFIRLYWGMNMMLIKISTFQYSSENSKTSKYLQTKPNEHVIKNDIFHKFWERFFFQLFPHVDIFSKDKISKF